jgi:hypothetical protein
MNIGDQAVLVNETGLKRLGLAYYLGRAVTLRLKFSPEQKRKYTVLDPNEDAWWVSLGHGPTSDYYVSAGCLQVTVTKQQQTQKETSDMYLYSVAVIKTPSVIAQQAGAIDETIVPATETMANEPNAAIASVCADNAEAIVKAKGSTIRVVVKQVG